MSCYLSTSAFGGTSISTAINSSVEMGVTNIELSAPHKHQPLKEIEQILVDQTLSGLKFTTHNYFPAPLSPFVLNPAASEQSNKTASLQLVRNAIRLSRASNSPVYGIHAGYLTTAKPGKNGEFDFGDYTEKNRYKKSLERATSFVQEVSSEFREAGVKLLIENLFPTPLKQHSLFCTIDEIREYMSCIDQDVGLLLDLGHLNVSSNILGFDKRVFLDQYMSEFGERVYEVHVSENKGIRDEHLPIKVGSWQLDYLKDISSVKTKSGVKRIICLEARKATAADLKQSLELINITT